VLLSRSSGNRKLSFLGVKLHYFAFGGLLPFRDKVHCLTRVKLRISFALALTAPCFFGQIQDSALNQVKVTEQELRTLQKETFFSRTEAERFAGNRKFLAAWDRIICNPFTLTYPLDSLREISVLAPADHRFRLITWNIPRDDGTHVYFGFLLANTSKRVRTGFLRHETRKNFECFKLQDRSALVKSPETYIGTPDKWFGMIYTQLIACGDNYTLIGWDGNDRLTQRKFIDVLYFKDNGIPVFGKDIFTVPRRSPRRLMFEYSSEVSMSIKFSEKQDMIIYSHLSSNREDQTLEGQYQFYGPDGSFDALVCKGSKWHLIEDIDARNEKSKNDNVRKPDPRKQKPVYKPK
jgi:hypothetical protein